MVVRCQIACGSFDHRTPPTSMAKKRRTKRPTHFVPYTHARFRPYVIALGQVALAWNGLHEALALLFCAVMGGGVVNQFLAVWHALKTDRAQRDILRAATNSITQGTTRPTLVDDVLWLCSRADSLEDTRNDIVHSPLWGYQRGPDEIIVMPVIGLGHTRAQKLFERNLLADFRWCRDAALLLTKFAGEMDRALSDDTLPWPERPAWPNRPATGASRPRTHR